MVTFPSLRRESEFLPSKITWSKFDPRKRSSVKWKVPTVTNHALPSGATYSMSLTKYLVHKSMGLDLKESLRLAQAAQEQARRSVDHGEAVRAFLDKRKPEFKGR